MEATHSSGFFIEVTFLSTSAGFLTSAKAKRNKKQANRTIEIEPFFKRKTPDRPGSIGGFVI